MRDLGVQLDSQLSMRPYINQITRSIHGHLRLLRRIRRCLDDAACAVPVQALVVSRLDYANSLMSRVPECALHRLQVAKNSAARLLSGTSRREYIGYASFAENMARSGEISRIWGPSIIAHNTTRRSHGQDLLRVWLQPIFQTGRNVRFSASLPTLYNVGAGKDCR